MRLTACLLLPGQLAECSQHFAAVDLGFSATDLREIVCLFAADSVRTVSGSEGCQVAQGI